ncbi:MAG: shikimate kinase [Planctomycetaceae bacterium]|nr:shikimate kinase [Planctomycetaceae bacterium]
MLLTLIGYRATGKTTLAKLLAERLGWDWIDADTEIERRAGCSIQQIFAEQGEPAFRNVEAQVIADLCRRDQLVLAAGGGVPLRPENCQAIRSAGKIVWLRATPETILARMASDSTTPARRPSLTAKDPLEEIVHLLEVRTPIYRELADLVVDTEGRSPAELAAEIIEWLHGHRT